MQHINEIVEITDSSLEFKGWLCVNTLNNGMAFGGCRFDLSVTRADVEQLAQCMTWKLAAHGLPVGGAKGGLCIDPRSPHIQNVIKAFAKGASEFLTTRVVLGKDLGATNELMDAMYASLNMNQLDIIKRQGAYHGPGRLRDLTGYRPHMTGLGVTWACQSALNDKIKGVRVGIQGSGAVGMGTAYHMFNLGARVVAMSDVSCAIIKDSGFSFSDLSEIISNGQIQREIATQKGAQVIVTDQLLTSDLDLLILAASSHSVKGSHAEKIKASTVAEGSNFGLTPDARIILQKRNVLVIPDILASSSSGAMVAYQLSSRNQLSYDDLWTKIHSGIKESVAASIRASNVSKVDLRTAYINEVVPGLLKKAANS
jgi:glutamate dehydrogenase/leucine dehydrogenase